MPLHSYVVTNHFECLRHYNVWDTIMSINDHLATSLIKKNVEWILNRLIHLCKVRVFWNRHNNYGNVLASHLLDFVPYSTHIWPVSLRNENNYFISPWIGKQELRPCLRQSHIYVRRWIDGTTDLLYKGEKSHVVVVIRKLILIEGQSTKSYVFLCV